MQNQKILLRAAQRIHAQLQSARTKSTDIELPEADWNHCQSVIRRMHRAQSCGWHNAAQALWQGLDYPLRACAERLEAVARQVSSAEQPSNVASVRDIFGDLVVLSDEFEGLSLELPEQTLSVTTPRIVLDGIDLGPFEIRLFWDRIGERHSYAVVSTEPNAARTSDETTHPHVRAEELCEGEGQMPMEKALRAGRLLDFFQIVHRILNTYNAESAYVSLSDWDGITCSDCGELVDSDDVSRCDRCDALLCEICSITCPRCEALGCNECAVICRGCLQAVCCGCTEACAGCSHLFCNQCLQESGLCQACEEEQHATRFNRDETTPVQSQATAPSAAGEAAAVPAPAAAAV
jgi:hypothetical protein